MANINFDDGFETFTINGDSNRVIKINPKDGNILIRFDEAMRDLKNESERLSSIKVKADGSPVEQAGISLEESTSRLGEFNQLINDKMDFIFNADVRQAAFGRQSPLSIVGPDNRFLFEIFLEAALEAVREKLEAATKEMESHAGKYTGQYKQAADIGSKYPFPVK